MLPALYRSSCLTLTRLRRDRHGIIAIATGLTLTALVGFAGLAVDVGAWHVTQRRMQDAADDAAFSAAVAAHAGGTPIASAKGITASAGFIDGQNGVTVVVNNPPTQGRYAGNGNGWEVVITQPQERWFASLYLSSPPVASARAVAHSQAGNSPYCVLALNQSGTGVKVSGSAAVSLSGCSMQVNSTGRSALNVGGNSQLYADTVSVTGDYVVGSSAQLLTTDPIDGPGAEPIPDPYANVQIPSYSGCDGGNHTVVSATVTLQPGVYCDGLKVNSTAVVTLSPGIYIIDRGSFSVAGGAVVSGTGVTIVLTSSTSSNYATVTVNGGSTVNLTASAPSTPTAGLVFYEDRRAPSSATATLNGGSGQSYSGALYFPSTSLTYSGNSGASACTQVVAGAIVYTGNTTTSSNCTNTGVATISSYSTVLAE